MILARDTGQNANRAACALPTAALLPISARRGERTAEAALELVLATGERLRIGAGVDTATLRAVLDVLRT